MRKNLQNLCFTADSVVLLSRSGESPPNDGREERTNTHQDTVLQQPLSSLLMPIKTAASDVGLPGLPIQTIQPAVGAPGRLGYNRLVRRKADRCCRARVLFGIRNDDSGCCSTVSWWVNWFFLRVHRLVVTHLRQ